MCLSCVLCFHLFTIFNGLTWVFYRVFFLFFSLFRFVSILFSSAVFIFGMFGASFWVYTDNFNDIVDRAFTSYAGISEKHFFSSVLCLSSGSFHFINSTLNLLLDWKWMNGYWCDMHACRKLCTTLILWNSLPTTGKYWLEHFFFPFKNTSLQASVIHWLLWKFFLGLFRIKCNCW